MIHVISSNLIHLTGAHLDRLHTFNYIDSGQDYQIAISDLRCDKCRFGCDSCDNEDQTCTIELNTIIRLSILVIQSFCVALVILASFLIFRLRKSRVSPSHLCLFFFILSFVCFVCLFFRLFFCLLPLKSMDTQQTLTLDLVLHSRNFHYYRLSPPPDGLCSRLCCWAHFWYT